MRVIVTGGSGRAGSYTVQELAAAGHEVINLDMARPPADLPGAFVQLDLTAAGDVGVARLVYASSEMATGWLTTDALPPRFPFDESDRVDSPNAYALSKYLGEGIADSMVRQYPSMSICSLRINNVIMPDGYDVLQYRRDTFPEGGVNFWSYIDVRDVASAFRAGLEGEISGHEVFLIAAADTCLDVPIEEAVARLYGPGARFAPDHGPFDSVFSCRRIAQRLGWKPRYSWRDG